MEEKTRSKDSSGRIPPQDIVAEKSLLGAIMLSNDALPDILMILRPRDFYEERHQTIFQAIIDLYDQHKPVDLLTLTAELRAKKKLKEVGGAAYLTEISNFVPAASHAKAYAEIIEKASVRRRLIKAGTEIANKAYEDDAEVDNLVGKAERELFEVSDNIITSNNTVEKETEPIIIPIEQEDHIYGYDENAMQVASSYNGFPACGFLEIPKTGLALPILSNQTVSGMEYSCCFLYTTGELNLSGNTYIVGHNYDNGALFSNNKNLAIGDKIIFLYPAC